jgi:hypothetical protein
MVVKMKSGIYNAVFVALTGFMFLACSASGDEDSLDDESADESVESTDEALSKATCAADARGDYCGTHYKLHGKGNPKTLYHCSNGKRTVKKQCKKGCYIRSGMNDVCL